MSDLIGLFSLVVLVFFAGLLIAIICKLDTVSYRLMVAHKQNGEILREIRAIRVFYANANPQVEAAIQQGFYKR